MEIRGYETLRKDARLERHDRSKNELFRDYDSYRDLVMFDGCIVHVMQEPFIQV